MEAGECNSKMENDLNGYGKRLTKMEIAHGRTEVKVETLEKSVAKIFDKIDSMQMKIAGLVTALQLVTILVLKYWK